MFFGEFCELEPQRGLVLHVLDGLRLTPTVVDKMQAMCRQCAYI